jgi:hypothetical protein
MTEMGEVKKCFYCGEEKPVKVLIVHATLGEKVFCSEEHWEADYNRTRAAH